MGVGAAIVGAGALAAGAQAYSGNQAASAQRKSAQQATDAQRGFFDITQGNLSPYMGFGQTGVNQLTGQLPSLTAPVSLTQSGLEATPGYQFNLSQGLKGVQNSLTSRGLGVSGAEQKAAAQYASGLANTTYQQQFENSVTNQQNTYNRLLQIAGLGENAAAGLGNQATTTGTGIGGNIVGAGNATAGSYLQTGNALGSLGSSVPNALLTNKLFGYLNNQNPGAVPTTGTQIPDFSNAFSGAGTGAGYYGGP